MTEENSSYIQKCKMFIKMMTSLQQWSGVSNADIDLWLNNFIDSTEEELFYIYKLLVNLIYFSEQDVNNILKDGLYNGLFYNDILDSQIENNFQLSKHALNSIVKEKITESYFIPLLDASKPHESGNYIMRQMVQNNLITTNQSGFPSTLAEIFDVNKFKRIVIVDDCVGSGQQLNSFWNESTLKYDNTLVLFKDWVKLHDISANYLTLFGYEDNILEIQKNIPELNICCVKMLRNIHRVFGSESYIWKNETERLKAKKVLEQVLKEKDIPLYGYQNLDFAFVMHRTIPDWSLPIFWKENDDFKCMIRRKNSNDLSI